MYKFISIHNTISHPIYADPTHYISRFVALTSALTEFLTKPPTPSTLCSIMNTVDLFSDCTSIQDHPILKEPDLYLHLAYATTQKLFTQEGNYSHNTCLNAWQFFTYIQQFTTLQGTQPEFKQVLTEAPYLIPVNAESSYLELDLKRPASFSIDTITDFMFRTTSLRKKRLFPQNEMASKKTLFKENLKRVPEKERYFLKVPIPLHHSLGDVLSMESVTLKYPFVLCKDAFVYYEHGPIFIPSYSILDAYLRCMPGGNNMTLAPIFGRIGTKTLGEMHTHHTHPLPCFSPAIPTNYPDVHGRACGPFLIQFHDLLHLTMSALMTKEEYSFLFHTLIPKITELKDQVNEKENISLLNTIIRSLADIDFETSCGFQSFAMYCKTNIKDKLIPPKSKHSPISTPSNQEDLYQKITPYIQKSRIKA